VLGGTGNGIQWVGVISAVQELTGAKMQARVLSVLESIGAAMPGIGYMLGGLIASGFGPRTTFTVAGVGVLAIALLSAIGLRSGWSGRVTDGDSRTPESDAEVVLELIPATAGTVAVKRSSPIRRS